MWLRGDVAGGCGVTDRREGNLASPSFPASLQGAEMTVSGIALHEGTVTVEEFKSGHGCKHSPATRGRADAMPRGGSRSLVCRDRAGHVGSAWRRGLPPEGGRDVCRNRVCWGLCNQEPAGLWRERDVNSETNVGRNRAPEGALQGEKVAGVWGLLLGNT